MNARTKLMSFGAYTKALELFDFVVADMALLSRHRECSQLAAQQLASADSIASNICLLYTSPSPRDRTRSRMPSSA